MSKPELLYGERISTDFVSPTSRIALGDTSTLQLNDVEIFYSLFELPMKAALARLPMSVHPSVPAIFAVNFWRVNASPIGPFTLGYIGLACRTGIKPRHFVINSWCDNPAAASLLREKYGFACGIGELDCRESYDRVRGVVNVDGEVCAEIVATELVPIVGAGAAVKYSPALNVANVDGKTALVQFEAAYAFKRAQRGRVAVHTYAAAAIDDPTIAPGYPIAGTFAVCDVQLLPVRFQVDLEVPAENGGATKLAADPHG